MTRTDIRRFRAQTAFGCVCALALWVLPPAAFCQQPSYEDELNNVLSTYQSLRQELISSQEAYRNLQQQYAAKTAELENKLKQPLVEKTVLEKEVQFVTDKIKECQARASQIAGEREVLQEKYDAMKSQSMVLEGSSAQHRARVASLEKENADLQAGIIRLQEEAQTAGQKLSSFIAASGAKEQSLDELARARENDARVCHQQVVTLEGEKAQLLARMEGLESRLKEKTDLAQSLNSVIADKEVLLGRLKGSQEAAASCELELAGLREKKRALTGQVDDLTAERLRLTDELRAAQAQLKEKEAALSALQNERAEQAASGARGEEKIASLRQENEFLASQVELMKSRVRPVEDAYHEAELARQQRQEVVASLTATIEGKDRSLVDLQKQRQDLVNRCASLEIDLERIAKEKDSLRQEMQACGARLNKLELERDTLASEVQSLRQSQQVSREEVRRLQSAVEESELSVYKLQSSLAAKEKDIDGLLLDKRFLKEELVETSSQLSAARADNDALTQQMGRQSYDGQSEKVNLEKRETECQARLAASEAQRNSLVQDRDDALAALNSTQRSLIELTDQLKAKEKAVAELTLSLDARTQALSDVQVELRRNRNELTEYTERRAQFEKDTLDEYVTRENLKIQVRQLEQTLQEREAELEFLRQDKQQQDELMQQYITQQTDTFARDSASLQEQLWVYQTEVVTLTDAKEKLAALLAEKEKSLADLQNQISLRDGDNGELTRLWSELTGQVKRLEDQCAAAEAKNAALQADLDQSRLLVEQREKQIQDQFVEVQQRAVLLQEENQRLLNEREQLLVSMSEKDQELKEREQALSEAAKTHADIQERLRQAELKNVQMTALRTDKDATGSNLVRLMREKDQSAAKVAALLAARERDVAKLSAQNEALQTRMAVMRDELTRVETEKTKVFAALREQEQEKTRHKTALDEKQRQVGELNTSLSQTQGQLAQAQKEIASLKENAVKATDTKLNDENQRLSSYAGANAEAINRLLNRISEQQEKNSALQQENLSLASINSRLIKENKAFRKKMDANNDSFSKGAQLKHRLALENAILHYNLGVLHLERQDITEAVEEFEKAVELNPNDAASHYNLGLIYAEYLDHKSKAIMHFKRYLAIDPKDKDADKAKKYIMTWEMWQEKNAVPQ